MCNMISEDICDPSTLGKSTYIIALPILRTDRVCRSGRAFLIEEME